MKKIGIIGSGIVAKTLAKGFIKYGCEVMLSSREPTKLDEWKNASGANARTGSFEDAAKYGELVVLAGKGDAAVAMIEAAGPQNLAGKTVIDTTNPLAALPPTDGVLHFFTGTNESLIEILQDRFPEINFVKAFNSVGNAVMVDPGFNEGKPTMFICGNNVNAKKQVTEILQQFGWDVEDLGTVAAGGVVEALCILWCIPGFLQNRWSHAFKLLKS